MKNLVMLLALLFCTGMVVNATPIMKVASVKEVRVSFEKNIKNIKKLTLKIQKKNLKQKNLQM